MNKFTYRFVANNKKVALQLFELFQKEFKALTDGIFSHVYVIDHDKDTKEIYPLALKKLDASGDAYRIDTTSDYSKRPTVYRQKYKVVKAIKSSLTLVVESAFTSSESVEYMLRDLGFWFKSHFRQSKVEGNSIFFYNDVEIQVSAKGHNLILKFIPL